MRAIALAAVLAMTTPALAAGTDQIDDSAERGTKFHVERALRCHVFHRIAAEGMGYDTPMRAEMSAVAAWRADRVLMHATQVAVRSGYSLTYLTTRTQHYVDDLYGRVMSGSFRNFGRLAKTYAPNCASLERDMLGALKRAIRDAR